MDGSAVEGDSVFDYRKLSLFGDLLDGPRGEHLIDDHHNAAVDGVADSEPSSRRSTVRRAKSARNGIAISEAAVVERRKITSGLARNATIDRSGKFSEYYEVGSPS